MTTRGENASPIQSIAKMDGRRAASSVDAAGIPTVNGHASANVVLGKLITRYDGKLKVKSPLFPDSN